MARTDKAMRLLYFAPHQMWPANTGARLRDYHLARQLAERFSVTFVEMRRAEEKQYAPPNDSGLAGVVTLDKSRRYTPSKVLRGLAGPTPVTMLNCWSPRSASQLVNVLRFRQFGSVQIEGVSLLEYLPIIQESLSCPAIVADWHNIESELMLRFANATDSWLKKAAAKRTAKLIERAEDRLLDAIGMHTVTSERERQILLLRRPGASIQVIPNGIDAGNYAPQEIAEANHQTGGIDSRQRILFVGSMDYHANIDAVVWFAQVAWPEIARNHPSLHFQIIGRDPAPAVRALASERIHISGTVQDVRSFYSSAIAAVVPLRSGSGTRLKILESMAAGVPVVSTRLGAEGIDAQDDIHLLLADSGAEIAAAVHRIVSSVETRTRLSQSARALVSQLYDWSAIGKRLCRVHAELIESRVPRSVRRVS